MSQLFDRALRLWSEPLPTDDAAAVAAFRSVYTDPVEVNGESTALQVLVDRARMLQSAFEGIHHEVKERFEGPGREAFAFRITGRHVGRLETPLGEIAATGRDLVLVGMDIFLVDDEADRVRGVWAVADYLDLLVQAGMLEPTSGSRT